MRKSLIINNEPCGNTPNLPSDDGNKLERREFPSGCMPNGLMVGCFRFINLYLKTSRPEFIFRMK
jgi:hypothetical protein